MQYTSFEIIFMSIRIIEFRLSQFTDICFIFLFADTFPLYILQFYETYCMSSNGSFCLFSEII